MSFTSKVLIGLVATSFFACSAGKQKGKSLAIDIQFEERGADDADAFQATGVVPYPMSFGLKIEGPKGVVFNSAISADTTEIEVPVGAIKVSAFYTALPLLNGDTITQFCANDGPRGTTSSPTNSSSTSSQNGGNGPDYLLYSQSEQTFQVTKDTQTLDILLPALKKALFMDVGARVVNSGTPVANANIFWADPLTGQKVKHPCRAEMLKFENATDAKGFSFDNMPVFAKNKFLVSANGVERMFETALSETDLSKNFVTFRMGTGVADNTPASDFDGDGISNQQEIINKTDPGAGAVTVALTKQSNGSILMKSSSSRYNAFFCKFPNSTSGNTASPSMPLVDGFIRCGDGDSRNGEGTIRAENFCGTGTLSVYSAVTNRNDVILYKSANASIAFSGGTCGGNTSGPVANVLNPFELNFQGASAGECEAELFSNPAGTVTSIDSAILNFGANTSVGTIDAPSTGTNYSPNWRISFSALGESILSTTSSASILFSYLDNSVSKSLTQNVSLFMGPKFENHMLLASAEDSPISGRTPAFASAPCGVQASYAVSNDSNSPRSSISVGNAHACALDNAGNARCWGDPNYSKTGQTSASGLTVSHSADPTIIGPEIGANKLLALVSGDNHTCALQDDYKVKCWGDGRAPNLGVLAHGVTTAANDGGLVSDGANSVISDFINLSSSGNSTCGVANNGQSLYCWGPDYPSSSALYRAKSITTGISGTDTLTQVAVHNSNLCYIVDIDNVGQQLKCSTDAGGTFNKEPFVNMNSSQQPLHQNGKIISLSVNTNFGCAVMEHGAVFCWPWNALANESTMPGLGRGLNNASSAPLEAKMVLMQPSGTLNNAISVVTSDVHACAMTKQLEAFCWGNNIDGLLGVNSAATSEPSALRIVNNNKQVLAINVSNANTCIAQKNPASLWNVEIVCSGNAAGLISSDTPSDHKLFFDASKEIKESNNSLITWAGTIVNSLMGNFIN